LVPFPAGEDECTAPQNLVIVHPNGSVCLLALIEPFGIKHGEAILLADSWLWPYCLAPSDSDTRWSVSTTNAEDTRPSYGLTSGVIGTSSSRATPCPAATHEAPTRDGIAWSNMSCSNGELAQHGWFNLSRPNKAVHGPVVNATYCTERPN
tara:strand:- start:1094 stop:1546 length:453 start_codon:yes stop_codon:yes gene_type:complete